MVVTNQRFCSDTVSPLHNDRMRYAMQSPVRAVASARDGGGTACCPCNMLSPPPEGAEVTARAVRRTLIKACDIFLYAAPGGGSSIRGAGEGDVVPGSL